jgi:hypothetical protein
VGHRGDMDALGRIKLLNLLGHELTSFGCPDHRLATVASLILTNAPI